MTTIAERIGEINKASELSLKAKQFVNLARVIALSGGNFARAQQIQQDNRVLLGGPIKSILAVPHRVYEMDRQKAAVLAGTTTDTTWAGPLAEYQTLANAFLESLRNWGAFDRMLPAMRQVPFRTRIGASTTGITGVVVGQAAPKPISRLTLSGAQIDELKATATLIVTDELAKFSGTVAGELFGTELSNAVAVTTDTQFIAVLTSGAASNPSGGATAEHVLNDLRGMLANVTTSARSQLFLLMTSAIAKVLSVLHTNTGAPAFPTMNYNGGQIGGIAAVVSDGVPAGTMVLADAQQIAAASETIQLSAADQATVQMDTVPDSPPTGATNQVSLWQNNLTALRAERFFGVQKLTTTGVAVLTGASYTGDSPGP